MTDEQDEQRFGEYHLVERIAVGGMAEVWKARAYGVAGFSKTLVIKKILDDLAKDEEFVRLFIDEAHIAVALQHSNIVQVFDLGRAAGTLFMAMEFVHGLDLAKLLVRARDVGPVPVALALYIVAEVLKALSFAHERRDDAGRPLRVVHCDLSPQNILLSHSGEVKLTDFGISRAAFQASSLHDTVRGKFAYMSPEQIDNRKLDHRSDVFSLGIVLWEVLTGRRLFKARDRAETMARVRRAEVPSPRLYRPEITEDLEGIVLKALSRRRDHRFASAAEMLTALGSLMNREGHRATNHDLSAYLRELGADDSPGVRPGAVVTTEDLLVLAAGFSPIGVGSDADGTHEIIDDWAEHIGSGGGEVWERGGSSILAVWRIEADHASHYQQVCQQVLKLQAQSRHAGVRVCAGLAPGSAKIASDNRRPPRGWELAGPFYLARWLMNLSAHRGRLLLTGSVARVLTKESPERLGFLDVGGGQGIEVYER